MKVKFAYDYATRHLIGLLGMKVKSTAVLLFLAGMTSATQINLGGKIAIIELIFLLFGPFVIMKHWAELVRDGFGWVLLLAVLWLVGAVISDVSNDIHIVYSLKGIAAPIVTFSSIVCMYVLLKDNLDNARWLFVGMFLSSIIAIFVFQRGKSGDLAMEQGMMAGVESVMSYKLFWVNKVSNLMQLPIIGWYQIVPTLYVALAMAVVSVFSLSEGGRSAFLIAIGSLFLLLYGGKKREHMIRIKRNLFFVIAAAIVIVFVSKYVYTYAVENGMLGENEVKKYERQVVNSRKGNSLLGMLMGGRADFFIGLIAAMDKPFIGHGSWAFDDYGYKAHFLSEYGTDQDYEMMQRFRLAGNIWIIPSHSHIICAWMWHGVFGLLFWAYVLWLLFGTLKGRMHIYPPLFGYLAIMLPRAFWDIFFSPNDRRFATAVLIVICLLIKRMSILNRVRGVR